MKKRRKLEDWAKILLIFLSVLIIFSAIVDYAVNREMTENIKQMVPEKVAGSWQI
ncbi:hypothetical protein NF868_01725 [Bacillus zhangzhouensis]|nr:hypothetical protein NF868_01725 [Bacillus zhangzhouensis]